MSKAKMPDTTGIVDTYAPPIRLLVKLQSAATGIRYKAPA